MTNEEKQLLLKDLCSRLPYGVKLDNGLKLRSIDALTQIVSCSGSDKKIDCIKPYLRPLSSMTEEERKEYKSFFRIGEYACGGSLYGVEYEYIDADSDDISQPISLIDWLNAHHFDYRGLIPMGLALEAPDGMYKTE